MASIVLGGVGSMFAGPLGGMIGGSLGSMIDRKLFNHPYVIKPNPWDLQVESAAFGMPVPIAYNRCLIAGNLIQSTNLIVAEHKGKGGKGSAGGKGNTQPYFTYSATFAVLICRTTDHFGNSTPLRNVWRIYADSKLLWSQNNEDMTLNFDNKDVPLRSAFTPFFDGSGNVIGGYATVFESGTSAKNANAQTSVGVITLYYGSEAQGVDPILDETFPGANTPAYRGYAYAVFTGFPLQWFGNRIPQLKFEVNGWPSNASFTDLSIPPSVLPPGGENQTIFTGSTIASSNLRSFPTNLPTGMTYVCDRDTITPVYNLNCEIINPIVNLNGGSTDSVISSTAGYSGGVTFDTSNQGAGGFGNDSTLWLMVQPTGGSTGGPALMQLIAGLGVKRLFPLTSPGGVGGLSNLSGSGFTCYCDNGLLAVVDDAARFQVYDMAQPDVNGNPSLALHGDLALNKIYQFAGVSTPTLVWSGTPGAGGFVNPTSVAWSATRNELVIYDGVNGVQFVIQGNGSSANYTSLTSIVGPVTRTPLDSPAYIAYDSLEDTFIYQSSGHVRRSTDVTSATDSTASSIAIAASTGFGNTLANQPLEGTVAVASNGSIFLFATASLTGVSSWSWSPALDTPNPTTAQVLYNPAYSGSLNWPTLDGNGFGFFIRIVGANSVGGVVGDIMTQCGLSSFQYDVSALGGTPLYGYPIGSEVSGRAAIEPLQEVYKFDIVESNGKLVVRLRQDVTAVPAFLLTPADLAARVKTEGQALGEDPPPRFVERRRPELDQPQQIMFRYRTASGSRYVQDFCMEIGTQYAKRNHAVVGAIGKISLNTPLVLTDAMAAQLAETILFEKWLQRTEFELALPSRYLACEQGDVISFQFYDLAGNLVTYLIYTTDVTIGADNTLQIKGLRTYPSVFVASTGALGGPTGGFLPVPNGASPPTPFSMDLALLDIPPLRDTDDSPGLYWGVSTSFSNSSPLWSATLQRSVDGGRTYASIGNTSSSAAIGVTTSALGASTGNNWDTANTLTVRFYSTGSGLESVTPEQVLKGSNVFAVGSEIVGACNVVLGGDGITWTLSKLLRGIQGTDIYNSTHVGGEKVVLLNGSDGSITDFDETLGDIGISEDYAAVMAGSSLATAALRVNSLTGARIKPEAAASAFITRDGSNNATISWIPRRRINWQWNDGPESPYTDESGGEEYSIDVYNGSTVVRTIAGWTTMTGTVGPQSGYDLGIRQATYSAADQTSDGLTPGNPIKVSIYQLSTRAGWYGHRGFARTITQ